MESGLPILNPTEGAPFKGDLLGRDESAHVLKQIVDTFGSGCVIGLNGKWGSGKTTFLRMWEAYMKASGNYTIVHFNSWENDDVSDPLIALIAEFKKLAGEEKIEWGDLKKKFCEVTWAMLPMVIGALAECITGIDLKEAIERGKEAYTDILDKSIEQYTQQKESITAFREELENIVKAITPKHPLIFVIDELDRCNPKFAVKLLERVKHLFEVEGIVFIISIDETQLCNSIRGYYGSEQFDARDYLRRFLRFTYDLPQAKNEKLVEFVEEAMERLDYNSLPQNREDKCHYKELHTFFYMLYKGQGMSLRQFEQYLLYTKLTLRGTCLCSVYAPAVALLVFLKMFEPDCFRHFVDNDWDESTFIDYIEKNFGDVFFMPDGYDDTYIFRQAVAYLMLIRCRPADWKEKLCDDKTLMFSVTRFNKEELCKCFVAPTTIPDMGNVLKDLNFVSRINIPQ